MVVPHPMMIPGADRDDPKRNQNLRGAALQKNDDAATTMRKMNRRK
jgi:hypothetical protein